MTSDELKDLYEWERLIVKDGKNKNTIGGDLSKRIEAISKKYKWEQWITVFTL